MCLFMHILYSPRPTITETSVENPGLKYSYLGMKLIYSCLNLCWFTNIDKMENLLLIMYVNTQGLVFLLTITSIFKYVQKIGIYDLFKSYYIVLT